MSGQGSVPEREQTVGHDHVAVQVENLGNAGQYLGKKDAVPREPAKVRRGKLGDPLLGDDMELHARPEPIGDLVETPHSGNRQVASVKDMDPEFRAQGAA